MKFEEKLRELRKKKNLTQEELASALFVSRTAISKWESGRGCPSIESLKQLANFFEVSIDELLSNNELLFFASEDKKDKKRQTTQLIFGLMNILMVTLLFLPFFGYEKDGIIHEVPLINLNEEYLYILIPYYIFITLSIFCGIFCICSLNINSNKIFKLEVVFSLVLDFLQTSFFMLSHQPYAGIFVLFLMMVKAILLIKNYMIR